MANEIAVRAPRQAPVVHAPICGDGAAGVDAEPPWWWRWRAGDGRPWEVGPLIERERAKDATTTPTA